MSPNSCLARPVRPEAKLRPQREKYDISVVDEQNISIIESRKKPAVWEWDYPDRKSSRPLEPEIWLFERVEQARRAVSSVVVRDPSIRHGMMVLKGTRFPVSRIFAELSEDSKLSDIAGNYDLDPAMLNQLFMALSGYLDE